jgi:hypothetical protein
VLNTTNYEQAVNDGVYIFKSGLNPYEGGNFHHVRLTCLSRDLGMHS